MDTWIDKPTAGSTIISIEADIQTDIIKELQQTPLPQKMKRCEKARTIAHCLLRIWSRPVPISLRQNNRQRTFLTGVENCLLSSHKLTGTPPVDLARINLVVHLSLLLIFPLSPPPLLSLCFFVTYCLALFSSS